MQKKGEMRKRQQEKNGKGRKHEIRNKNTNISAIIINLSE